MVTMYFTCNGFFSGGGSRINPSKQTRDMDIYTTTVWTLKVRVQQLINCWSQLRPLIGRKERSFEEEGDHNDKTLHSLYSYFQKMAPNLVLQRTPGALSASLSPSLFR